MIIEDGKVLVDTLSGDDLDIAVSKATGKQWTSFHKSWSVSGQLLEDYAVSVKPITDASWEAEEYITHSKASGIDEEGKSGYLEAALRVVVKCELGDYI